MLNQSLDTYIVEQTSDALIYADTAGKIQRWNSAATNLFGFNLDEVLGQSLDLIIPENLRAPHWKGCAAAMQNGELKLSGKPTLTRALHKAGYKLY